MYKSACLSSTQPREITSISSGRRVDVVSFCGKVEANASIIQAVADFNWQVVEHSFPLDNLRPGGIVLVLDELSGSLLKDIQETQWHHLQTLLSSGNRILWITEGSQYDVTNPDGALVHGLARSVRAEDPSVSLTTLDVGSKSSISTPWAVNCILETLTDPPPKRLVENEYAERDGVIYISRILPDDLINQAQRDDANGAELETVSLHETQGTVRLRCERVGILESLNYAHVSATDLPLMEDCVEVELVAAGVNFKVSIISQQPHDVCRRAADHSSGYCRDNGHRSREPASSWA